MDVEYMDRAQGPTVDFFAQTLRDVRYIAETSKLLRGLGEVRFGRLPMASPSMSTNGRRAAAAAGVGHNN